MTKSFVDTHPKDPAREAADKRLANIPKPHMGEDQSPKTDGEIPKDASYHSIPEKPAKSSQLTPSHQDHTARMAPLEIPVGNHPKVTTEGAKPTIVLANVFAEQTDDGYNLFVDLGSNNRFLLAEIDSSRDRNKAII